MVNRGRSSPGRFAPTSGWPTTPSASLSRRTRSNSSCGTRWPHLLTIERWHQTLKNRILLENYYLPGELEAQVDGFVAHYNHQRYHESLHNLTPADVYLGRGQAILLERERIKRQTIQQRRLLHHSQTA
jgi:transposase InsO family protein